MLIRIWFAHRKGPAPLAPVPGPAQGRPPDRLKPARRRGKASELRPEVAAILARLPSRRQSKETGEEYGFPRRLEAAARRDENTELCAQSRGHRVRELGEPQRNVVIGMD